MNSLSTITVITGASSGLGEGLARRFATDGNPVVLLARRQENLDAIVADLRAQGHQVWGFMCDVTNAKQQQAVIAQIEAEIGPIGCFVANAGISVSSPSAKFNVEVYEKTWATNVFGVLYGLEAVIPAMKKRGCGHIVTISSLAAYRGLPEAGAYCSSKAALTALSESLRVDLKPFGITVSVIHPGWIKTPLTDRNRYKMPFIMPLDKGVDVLYHHIRNKTPLAAFPQPLSTAVRLARLVPTWLYDLAVGKRRNKKT
ncbi:MAG: SDR family NAD(P)-dependent oxidoreductase [Candidatus Margulisiibacteriota bacterium]